MKLSHLTPLILGASLLEAGCSLAASQKAPDSCFQNRSEHLAAPSPSLAERYRLLKQDGAMLEKTLFDQQEEDREITRACVDTHLACSIQVASLYPLFTKHLDTSACDKLGRTEKFGCSEEMLKANGDFAHLIVLQETSNACARVITGCTDHLKRVVKAADLSDGKLTEKEASASEDRMKQHENLVGLLGQPITSFLEEEACGKRNTAVLAARRQAEHVSELFFNNHRAEVVRCEQKPPQGLELIDGACERHVLQQYPADQKVIKEARGMVSDAHQLCMEKLRGQLLGGWQSH